MVIGDRVRYSSFKISQCLGRMGQAIWDGRAPRHVRLLRRKKVERRGTVLTIDSEDPRVLVEVVWDDGEVATYLGHEIILAEDTAKEGRKEGRKCITHRNVMVTAVTPPPPSGGRHG